MTDDVYRRLQKHIDDLPIAYPATLSGVVSSATSWTHCSSPLCIGELLSPVTPAVRLNSATRI